MEVNIVKKGNHKVCTDDKKRKCRHENSNICLNCSVFYGNPKKNNLFELKE